MNEKWVLSQHTTADGEPIIKLPNGLWAATAYIDASGSGERITASDARKNAELIVATQNLCVTLNPDNPLAAANALADAVAALEGLVAAMDKRRPPVGAEGGYTGIFGSYEFDDAREALARLKGGEQ